MVIRIFALLFTFGLLLSSCGTKKRTTQRRTKPRTAQTTSTKPDTSGQTTTTTTAGSSTAQQDQPDTTQATPKDLTYAEAVAWYIETFSQVAQQEMELYKIPASITMAQGILESGAGRSDLTQRANNHFGIKCHTQWTGERVYHDDDELQECFRKYIDAKYSFRDHSLFLTERRRYSGLFDLAIDDYKGWARGLKRAGYATDPKYPNKLISIIERYQLYKLDEEVLAGGTISGGGSSTTTPARTTYVVKQGDTLYSIARRHNLSVDALKAKNGLTSNAISIGQTLDVGSEN